jgi:hypothetical protein
MDARGISCIGCFGEGFRAGKVAEVGLSESGEPIDGFHEPFPDILVGRRH